MWLWRETVAKVVVSGIAGCIGSWVALHLLSGGHEVVGLDFSEEHHRLRLLGIDGAFPLYRADVRDFDALRDHVRQAQPDAVIHLAAFQVPTCKARPLACVEVNVGGTLNFLELARSEGFPLVYASSAAVFGPDLGRTLGELEGLTPQNLYGVFKRTGEEMARIYAQDYGVRSAGFRPYVVYGPGRDVGMTADITLALLHAARGEPFHIRFGGTVALQHASDVARAFIAAALDPPEGARVYNLRGAVVAVPEIVALIERVTETRGLITHGTSPLPIAADISDAAFQRDYGPFAYKDLETGFRETLEVWRAGAHV